MEQSRYQEAVSHLLNQTPYLFMKLKYAFQFSLQPAYSTKHIKLNHLLVITWHFHAYEFLTFLQFSILIEFHCGEYWYSALALEH